jgi:Transposase and inactivated derivatives
MSKALSLDLRIRVLAAVASGFSHRQAAERFGVSAASVSRWRAREREQGAPLPKALGGDRRSGRIDACKALILSLLEETPDLTIEELRQALSARGHRFGFGTIQRFLTLHATEQDRPDILKQRRSGSRVSLIWIRPGWCSSMRRGRRPTWFARMVEPPEVNGCGPVHLMATGAQPPSLAR